MGSIDGRFPWEMPAGNGKLGGRPQLTAGIRAGSYAHECSNLRNPASIERGMWDGDVRGARSGAGSLRAVRCETLKLLDLMSLKGHDDGTNRLLTRRHVGVTQAWQDGHGYVVSVCVEHLLELRRQK